MPHNLSGRQATAPHSAPPPAAEQPQLLLTVAQAAQRLGVGRSTAYQLMATGELESIHVGRLRRIPVDEVTSFIDRRRAAPPEVRRVARVSRLRRRVVEAGAAQVQPAGKPSP